MLRIMIFLLMMQTIVPNAVSAQQRQLSLEANPVHGTLAYGWPSGSSRWFGVEVGFGFPQLDRTLNVGGASLIDFVHVGVFKRVEPSRNFAIDGRWQLGLAELRGCSGGLPGLFTGLSSGALVGGRRAKIGTRLTAGLIKEQSDPTTFVLNWTPLAALFSFGL
jgi:hypothetical protein